MQTALPRNWRPYDILISFLVIVLLLVFTYALLFIAPYPGFYFNPSDGQVLEIYQSRNSNPDLQKGDFIKRVGSISLEVYLKGRIPFFPSNTEPGDTYNIIAKRGNETITIPWVYAGINALEFQARFFNIWWLAYIFWLIAIAAQLFMRPKDERWLLFTISNYLTAIFIMVGSLSSFRIFLSAFLLRAVAWLILPTYLHFHWIFPKPLWPVSRQWQVIFYISCGLMALSELFLPTPKTLYFLAVILAFFGSILLLFLHYIFQPEYRRELKLLALAAFLALFPVIVLSIASSSGTIPYKGPVTLLALPILPGAYFYVLYQRNLGQLELRVNRAISLAIFLVLLGTLLLLAVGYSGYINIPQEELAFATVVVVLGTTITSLLLFPVFQSFVERRLLGIKLPDRNLSENFSARIVTSDTQVDLLKLLHEEVFPSLLIRQYAFVRNFKSSAEVMLSENVTQAQVRAEALLDLFASIQTSSLLPLSKLDPPFEWVQLMLPLRFGSELMGVWLLGRRDPDDRYSQAEIPVLQSLANQTAIALSNILQIQQVREMYEANIVRHEQERARLARDLHDSVLNELAALLMSSEAPIFSPKFKDEYDEVSQRLREIVSDLRPPMLNFGLKLAFEELADNLMERNQSSTQIMVNLVESGECRYGEAVEINLYRIVQEACQNALRSAHAKTIQILGILSPESIDIAVEDDGNGFAQEIGLKLNELIANKHFGLANMLERAYVIGAEIKIDSKPGRGTKVHAVWTMK